VNQTFGESDIGPIEWLFNRGPYRLGGGSDVTEGPSLRGRMGQG
jgi:penicillin amidase